MSFTTSTLDEIHNRMLAHLRGRMPDANLAPLSDYWLRSRAVAVSIWVEQQGVVDTQKQILLTDADAANVPRHVAERLGEDNAVLPATKAIGKIAVTSAAAAAVISTGQTLTHASGAQFRVTAGTVTHDPAFSGKTALYGSSAQRVLCNPTAADVDVDDIVSITSGSIKRAVKAVLPESGTAYALDFYQDLDAAPAIGDAIAAVIGAVVAIEAVDAGAAGNLIAGDTLTWDSPGSLDADAIVCELSGGSDAEEVEGTRRRGLAFIRERPASGNRSDLRQWAVETPEIHIEDACVFLGYRGLGTMDIVPIGTTGARVVGSSVLDRITDYIESQASEFDDIMVRILDDESPGVDVALELTVVTNYEPDWTGTYVIDTGSTLTEVMLTAAPDLIELDDRVLVMVQDGPLPGLYQRTVTGKSATSITLDEELPAAPTAADHVDPGGPVTAEVIANINAIFDTMGPGDPGGFGRFPDAGEAWEWRLFPERLSAAALAVTGVEGCDVTTPIGVTTPAQFARLVIATLRIVHE